MQSKLPPTPALLLSSHHTLVVYYEVTMVLARFQRMSGLLAATTLMVFLAGCALGTGPMPGPTPTPAPPGQGLTALNHIVFMAQENRSFDTYFGHLNDYRA